MLWCLRDHRVYIGQTGGRQYLSRVCDKGAEHVRLAMDYLRLSDGRKIFLPRSVYRWMAQKGVENFVITPLECCAQASADARENFWMLKWGTSRLFNVDVPSVSSGKWGFLSTRKVWKHELQTQGPAAPHRYPPATAPTRAPKLRAFFNVRGTQVTVR